MTLQQLLWMVTALGALVAAVALAMLGLGRAQVREPGLAAVFALVGALLCGGGFLLSEPRLAATSLIAGGAAVVGVLVGWGLTRPPRRR